MLSERDRILAALAACHIPLLVGIKPFSRAERRKESGPQPAPKPTPLPLHPKGRTFCRARATLVSRKDGAAWPKATMLFQGQLHPCLGIPEGTGYRPRLTPAIKKAGPSIFYKV